MTHSQIRWAHSKLPYATGHPMPVSHPPVFMSSFLSSQVETNFRLISILKPSLPQTATFFSFFCPLLSTPPSRYPPPCLNVLNQRPSALLSPPLISANHSQFGLSIFPGRGLWASLPISPLVILSLYMLSPVLRSHRHLLVASQMSSFCPPEDSSLSPGPTSWGCAVFGPFVIPLPWFTALVKNNTQNKMVSAMFLACSLQQCYLRPQHCNKEISQLGQCKPVQDRSRKLQRFPNCSAPAALQGLPLVGDAEHGRPALGLGSCLRVGGGE